ncbi:type IV pilus modification PilV family protein [Bradyrhizobium paxllaeri]|uniref:type IV pilus modification PilV family protein n=1 Tax=Bradyrhizobium paxllaeri TaxID=190148 RepID=UPI000810426B|nr:type II secretion system protein [Bradyrhizobium paxllaeri]
MLARRKGERGFALLEILVAFVILALGLGAISTGVVVAMRSDARTQVNRTALRVAQSRLEAAGVSEMLVPGTREGLVANKFRWRQTVTEVRVAGDTRAPSGAQPAPASGALKSFWVEVAVEAPDGAATKLAALKLATEAGQ